jgi:hypothetical protein
MREIHHQTATELPQPRRADLRGELQIVGVYRTSRLRLAGALAAALRSRESGKAGDSRPLLSQLKNAGPR